MHQSHAIEVQHRGSPAQLTIIRNDGFAWGRLTFPAHLQAPGCQPEPLDVSIPDPEEGVEVDLYDETDSDALDMLQEALANGTAWTEEATSWIE